MNPARHAVIVTAFIALGRSSAASQVPKGADTLPPRAVADSQAVLRDLDSVVRANPRDAAAWYRRGMVAWVLALRPDAKPPVRGLDPTRIRRVADTSLRIAAELAPKNVAYEMAMGDFLRSAPDPTARLAASRYFDAALAAVHDTPDPVLHARVALEAGRIHWLRYDTDARQLSSLVCPDVPQSIDSARIIRPRPQDDTLLIYLPTEMALNRLHNQIIDCGRSAADAGIGEYDRAEALFREAYGVTPGDTRAFRHLAMLLAEKNRWRELMSVARDRVNRVPNDGWAWLDLGLAMHRGGASDRATAVFDTATSRLDPAERGRLFAFQRLLKRPDSATYMRSAAETQTTWERTFWAMADPLWSREGNDPHTEFLARVTFAELRWTVDELGVRGADSDRGEIHIRYGPPDRMVAMRGCNSADCARRAVCASPGCMSRSFRDMNGVWRFNTDEFQAKLPSVSDVVTFWDYDNGLSVVFWGAPTYGTARFPVMDTPLVERAIELRPAAFDNVAAERIVGMPSRATRFRATPDSVDLLLIAQAPMAEIRAAAAPNAEVRGHFWLLGPGDEIRDSVALRPSGVQQWTYRVPTARYMYRVEATADGAMIAGRTSSWITAGRDSVTGFSTSGFGVSDLLLATIVQPGKPVPVRWRDFNVAPLLGALPRQGRLEIVWENYDMGARTGQSQYSVAVTLQRERSAGGRIAAAVLGVAASAIGIDRRDDRVSFRFERSGPAAPVAFVDRISLAMNDTPAGDYRLTLDVTDKATGRKASSTSQLTIAK